MVICCEGNPHSTLMSCSCRGMEEGESLGEMGVSFMAVSILYGHLHCGQNALSRKNISGFSGLADTGLSRSGTSLMTFSDVVLTGILALAETSRIEIAGSNGRRRLYSRSK